MRVLKHHVSLFLSQFVLLIFGLIFFGCSEKVMEPADNASPGRIVDLAAIDPTDTTITLTWTAPGDNDFIGTAKFYLIRFSTAPITESNWQSATPIPNTPQPRSAGEPETFVVQNLESYSGYYFGIRTADESGNWSPISNIADDSTTFHIYRTDFPTTVGSYWVYEVHDLIDNQIDTVELKIIEHDTWGDGTPVTVWVTSCLSNPAKYYALIAWSDTAQFGYTGDILFVCHDEFSSRRLFSFPLSPGAIWAGTNYGGGLAAFTVSIPETIELPGSISSVTLRVNEDYDGFNEGYHAKYWIAPGIGIVAGSASEWFFPGGRVYTWALIEYHIPAPQP